MTDMLFRTALVVCSLLLFSCVSPGQIEQPREIASIDGIGYRQLDRKLGDNPVKVNVLELDPTKVRLDVHHANDRAIGVETTSAIAKRLGAVAAINAGFFRLDKSDFAGEDVDLLLIDGKLLSEPRGLRSAVAIRNHGGRTEIDFDRFSFSRSLKLGGKKLIDMPKGVDRELRSNDIVVFGPEFGENAPIGEGFGIVVSDGRYRQECLKLCPIPADGFVVAATGDRIATLRSLKVRDKISWEHKLIGAASKKDAARFEDAVAGVPIIVRNGKADIPWEQEKAGKSFTESRHPRTAIGKTADGKILLVTVDGRRPGVSVGMSLAELADLMLSLGAVDALNLDGGGSTTMYYSGRVVNRPSDASGERSVGDAILVTLRNK